jgi:long-chain acyl-CoA synthetase
MCGPAYNQNHSESLSADKIMPRENLLTLLSDFARHANDVAIVQHQGYRRQSFAYQKILQKSVDFAVQLKSRGVHTGDRVLLWAPNSAEWLIAFWGILLRGAVAVPMDDLATPDFAARVARQATVKLIVKSENHAPLDAGIPTTDVSALSDTTNSNASLPPWQSLSDEPITRSHLAQILFTSGTTAEPRGVLLTHGNFLANLEPLEKGIDPYRKYERWFHPLRFVSLVPLSHVFGQFMTLLVPPLLGVAVIFESSNNPRDIIHTIKQERATALVAVPRILDLLRGSLERNAPASFPQTVACAAGKKFLRRAWLFRNIHKKFGWKFWAFICGGAALPPDTEDFFKRLGYAVVQGYGMTETASLISLNHPFRATQGSIGKILPGRQFKLAEDGEILIRGENVSQGYWRNFEGGPQQQTVMPREAREPLSDDAPKPAATDSQEDGWLRTGDLGELDKQGNLRFRGRKKNVIVTSAGLNIYPDDLESALRKQPQIRDCLVIPLSRQPSPATEVVATGFSPSSLAATISATQENAEPCAILLLNPAELDPANAATQAIRAANATLADFQQIRSWLIWPDPDFPRTSTGKPRQAQIAERAVHLLGTPTPLHPAGSAGCISRSAPLPLTSSLPSSNSALTQLLTRFSSTPNADLQQNLNLSSLDRVELLSTLESQFHVELNETALAQAKTVADIQNLLRQPQARRTEYVYPRWAQREPVRFFRLLIYYALVWPATQILAHPKIRGRENLANLKSPALIVSNHITRRADIGLILAALPARFRHRLATAMGGETLHEMRHPPKDWFPPKRWLYYINFWLVTALFNVFPLPQFSGFRDSFEFAGESADRNYSLLVFPEGVVNDSPDGRMAKFQPGIGLLAQNLGLPIIPMRLDGVAQMKQAHRRLAKLGEITVHIGAPITFPPDTPPEAIARQLELEVASLR